MEIAGVIHSSSMHRDTSLWRCMVCNKPSVQIHVLPCQHKFCEPCLKLWAMIYVDMYHGMDKEFPCQVCWKQYTMPSEGLKAFKEDYEVRCLQQTMGQLSMDQQRDDELQKAEQDLAASPRDNSDQPQHGCTLPSMLSHMAPSPVSEAWQLSENKSSSVPDYCVRSRHMYMHLL